jgi:hypothetical protein
MSLRSEPPPVIVPRVEHICGDLGLRLLKGSPDDFNDAISPWKSPPE